MTFMMSASGRKGAAPADQRDDDNNKITKNNKNTKGPCVHCVSVTQAGRGSETIYTNIGVELPTNTVSSQWLVVLVNQPLYEIHPKKKWKPPTRMKWTRELLPLPSVTHRVTIYFPGSSGYYAENDSLFSRGCVLSLRLSMCNFPSRVLNSLSLSLRVSPFVGEQFHYRADRVNRWAERRVEWAKRRVTCST